MSAEAGVLAAQALIGAMLLDNHAADEGLAQVQAEQFYQDTHRTVYAAIQRLRSRRNDVDITTVLEDLKRSGHNNIGPVTLSDWISQVGSSANLITYAKDVRRSYYDRLIHSEAVRLTNAGTDRLEIEQRLRTFCVKRESEDVPPVMTFGKDLHKMLDALSRSKPSRLLVGISGLDEIMHGLEPGDLLTVGGRTSYGKTVMMTTLAMNLAKSGSSIVYFSTEAKDVQLMQRIFSSETGQSYVDYRNRRVNWQRTIEAAAKLQKLQFAICDIPNPSLRDIESIAFSQKAQVVVVDYLQRCNLPKAESHRLRISEFMRGLKNLCRNRNVIGIAGSQIDRQVDRKEDKPPVLADLKESGDLENESDSVILLWAPTKEMEGYGSTVMTVLVAKNKHGPKGRTKLLFEKEYMRITQYYDTDQSRGV